MAKIPVSVSVYVYAGHCVPASGSLGDAARLAGHERGVPPGGLSRAVRSRCDGRVARRWFPPRGAPPGTERGPRGGVWGSLKGRRGTFGGRAFRSSCRRFVVTVRDQPRAGALLDDVCRFEVLLPPGSGRGPLVDRGYIRLLGLDSAPTTRCSVHYLHTTPD